MYQDFRACTGESRGESMIDLYEMLTPDELDIITDIFKEAMGRNGHYPDCWEPILQVESDQLTT